MLGVPGSYVKEPGGGASSEDHGLLLMEAVIPLVGSMSLECSLMVLLAAF